MLKKFAKYYKPHMKLFLFDLFCAFLVSLCSIVYPILVKLITNNENLSEEVNLILYVGLGLFGIYLLKAILNFIIQYWGHKVGVLIQSDMRRDLFAKFEKLPYTYFDKNKTGTMMSRIVNDLMDISEMAHHAPEDIFLSIITMIGCFIAMGITVNFKLSLIVFAFIPFIVAFAAYRRRKMSKASKKTRVQVGIVNAEVENSLTGVRVTKAYGNEAYENKKFASSISGFQNARMSMYKQMGIFHSGMNFFVDILYLVSLVSGGLFYAFKIDGFSALDFATYLMFITILIDPIRKLINIFDQIQNGMTGFERFIEIMNEDEEDLNLNGINFTGLKEKIEFKDVKFSYENEETKVVLNNMSFIIEKGKTTALVGPTGGGKTTICNLLPRFYKQDQGEILFDGIDSSKFNLVTLRDKIGIVSQDVFLFSGTIRENIVYGNLSCSEEEMIEAAKKANIHQFIMSLEKGYDTDIGERGVRLSGGQKQRISIARAFLKNPEILILDEATSALDTVTEVLIQEAISRLSVGRTVLVVAHRLSTIKNADNIIVLTQNGIEESGTHEELLAKQGIYHGLYNAQFRIF